MRHGNQESETSDQGANQKPAGCPTATDDYFREMAAHGDVKKALKILLAPALGIRRCPETNCRSLQRKLCDDGAAPARSGSVPGSYRAASMVRIS